MTDTNHAGNRRFAHNLFSAKDEDGDLVRGAALSVLNATNRVLGTYFLTR